MREKEHKIFPGQQTGMIRILIKPTEQEETMQLRFDLVFEESLFNK